MCFGDRTVVRAKSILVPIRLFNHEWSRWVIFYIFFSSQRRSVFRTELNFDHWQFTFSKSLYKQMTPKKFLLYLQVFTFTSIILYIVSDRGEKILFHGFSPVNGNVYVTQCSHYHCLRFGSPDEWRQSAVNVCASNF